MIRDTLSTFLDDRCIRPGASSHPYSWQLLGNGIVEFRFDDILLPDSNVNPAGSQGFVHFQIKQQPDLPLETLIENEAAIYFDFNEPVITNTVRHRIGENFLPLVVAWEPSQAGVLLQVTPNPVGASARVELKDWAQSGTLTLQLFDIQGNLVRQLLSDGTVFELNRDSLPAGFYTFQVIAGGGLLGRGKLVFSD